MAKKEKLQNPSIDFDAFVQQQLEENPHFSLETVKIIFEQNQSNNIQTNEE